MIVQKMCQIKLKDFKSFALYTVETFRRTTAAHTFGHVSWFHRPEI